MDLEYYISDIKEINSKRRLIYLNYEPAFALYPAEIRRFEIKKDHILSQDNYKEITEVLLVKRAKLRSMNLLKSKDYTIWELTMKLKDNYYPDIAIETAIAYVKSYGYLNDQRFADNYVAFKSETKSRKQIEQFLRNKGIDATLIQSVCDSYYDEHLDTELNQAVRHLKKKLGTKNLRTMEYAEKNKICAYLYRHGFGMEVVKKALDIVVDETSES